MRKKILIISNPGARTADNYCEGVHKDVENYKKFFMSPGGGNWHLDEIECMEQPLKPMVQKKLIEMENLDFSIIMFTGHGYSKDENTYIELVPSSSLYNDMCVDELKQADQKRIIIVDCCRKKLEPTSEINEAYLEHVDKSFSMTRDTREIYEELIRRLDVMNIVMYACDWNETSGDDSRKGGYYTSSLLRVCSEFIEECRRSSKSLYLSAPGAHEMSKPYVKRLKSDQNPQIEKPRSGPYLPLVIFKGMD